MRKSVSWVTMYFHWEKYCYMSMFLKSQDGRNMMMLTSELNLSGELSYNI